MGGGLKSSKKASCTVCQGLWPSYAHMQLQLACACQYSCQLKPLFYISALIFFNISTCEESSLPMKHAKNYCINILAYEGHYPIYTQLFKWFLRWVKTRANLATFTPKLTTRRKRWELSLKKLKVSKRNFFISRRESMEVKIIFGVMSAHFRFIKLHYNSFL